MYRAGTDNNKETVVFVSPLYAGSDLIAAVYYGLLGLGCLERGESLYEEGW